VDGYITIINIVNTEIKVPKGKKNHEAEAEVKIEIVAILSVRRVFAQLIL
tara:strand:+ start:996 stop:1145 length:150 start_codon:yes stop_codon:yes gene_type:complete